MKKLLRWAPLILIATLMLTAYFTGITNQISWESLRAHHHKLHTLVTDYPISAPLLFILLYMLSTTLSLPIGIYLSIFAGFLFPQPLSTLYVLIGATIGATNIFLAAKTALQDTLKKRAGPFLQKMQTGFQKDAASYLLFLRLVPLFPFWVVNLAPAFFGVPLSTFIWTTFVGIIPGAFVLTQAGRGLSALFETDAAPSLETIFNFHVKIALIALALFALLPIVIKRLRKE